MHASRCRFRSRQYDLVGISPLKLFSRWMVLHHGHPSRLCYGSLRSALTGPGRHAREFTNTRKWQPIFWRRRWLRLPLVGTQYASDSKETSE